MIQARKGKTVMADLVVDPGHRQPSAAVVGVIVGATADILDRIADPRVSLVVWERTMQAALAAWLDTVPGSDLPTDRFSCANGEGRQDVTATFADAGVTDDAAAAALIDDIAGLMARFARISGASRLDVRMERVTDDACARFHVDNIALRLLCTYRGPGTQWLCRLADPGQCGTDTGAETDVRQLPRFAVALFKGGRAAGARVPPIRHRSPPIACTGQTRFLLCINEAAAGGG